MLSGKHRKFAEGIVAGLTATAAYAAAYPNTKLNNARKNAPRLMDDDRIKSEVALLRAKADEKAGSAVMTCMEQRIFLARLLRANITNLDLSKDGDLLASYQMTKHGIKLRLHDKLAAIARDNDLAGADSSAKANDSLAALLQRVRR